MLAVKVPPTMPFAAHAIGPPKFSSSFTKLFPAFDAIYAPLTAEPVAIPASFRRSFIKLFENSIPLYTFAILMHMPISFAARGISFVVSNPGVGGNSNAAPAKECCIIIHADSISFLLLSAKL